jgi:hypothetical protein
MLTREEIEKELLVWAERFELSEPEWTQDTSITLFTGRTVDGGYRIYAFSMVGGQRLENVKIVSGTEVKSARPELSPYLAAQAECYNELAGRVIRERS